MRMTAVWLLAAACLATGCAAPSSAPPSASDVKAFLDNANETSKRLGIESGRAGWVQQTFITDDTEAIAARANQLAIEAGARFAKGATKFDKVDVPDDQRRQLNLLKVGLVLAAPSDPKESDELTKIAARLESTYGKGKWCPDPAKPDACKNVDDATKIMAASRNEKELRATWEGWHSIGPPMRGDYTRFAALSNKGAKELGFADTGAMWRAKWSATPAHGTSTWRPTSASRCASSRRPKTSRRSITSSDTTTTSAPTRGCQCCSVTARTTASTKRSAT